MDERPTAEIIAFPAKPTPPDPEPQTDPALPDNPQDRLRRALVALDAALATQRTAMKTWRESLADLKGSMQGLGTSLSGYQDTLGKLGTSVTALNTEARRLEAWSDAALSPNPSA